MDPYQITIGGVKADPMRIVKAYGITDMGIAQAVKKLLRCGRKHKTKAQDVREAITSLERWEEIESEDGTDRVSVKYEDGTVAAIITQPRQWKPGWNKLEPQGDEARPKSVVLQPRVE